MITLVTYPAMGLAFSLSPFCCKAAMMLDYAGVDWQREDTSDPRKMPQAKLPAIRTPKGEVIGDSDGIRAWLEAQGTDFMPGLSDVQKAHSRALIRMAEEHLYFHIVHDRWGRDAVWPTIRARYFSDMPAILRRIIPNRIRRDVLRGLSIQGVSRFGDTMRAERAEQDLSAIAALLWQGPFLMGPQLTLADMSVAPMLNAARQTPVETPLALRVAGDAILVDYIERVEQAIARPAPQPLRLTA